MQKRRAEERIHVIGEAGENTDTLFDLSVGGASCFYDRKKEKGSFVRVTINQELTLRAKVSFCAERIDGYRMGLQFWETPPEKRQALVELVEKFSRGVPLKCSVEEDEQQEE